MTDEQITVSPFLSSLSEESEQYVYIIQTNTNSYTISEIINFKEKIYKLGILRVDRKQWKPIMTTLTAEEYFITRKDERNAEYGTYSGTSVEYKESFDTHCKSIMEESIIPFLKLREKFINHLNEN